VLVSNAGLILGDSDQFLQGGGSWAKNDSYTLAGRVKSFHKSDSSRYF